MSRRLVGFVTVLVVGATGVAFTRGGWAVITVKDVPAALTVGTPTEIAFMIRQHGEEAMHGLTPVVEARTGSLIGGTSVQATAAPGRVRGEYVASLTVPSAGDWRITVKSGFGPSNLQLLPIRAGTATAARLAAADVGAERGRHLFVAKGCVMCHVHTAAEGQGGASTYGPKLGEKKFDAAYLEMWLANPAIRPPTKPGQQMPNLGLSKPEITALTAFVNTNRVASER